MEDANNPEEVVEQHARLLSFHDVGDPGFACLALRFAQMYNDLVRRASGAVSGQGQVLQVIAVLADEDRLTGTVLGSKDRARLHAENIDVLKSVLPHCAVFDLPTRHRIHADLDVLTRATLGPVLCPLRGVMGRLIANGVAFVDAHPSPASLAELRRGSTTSGPFS